MTEISDLIKKINTTEKHKKNYCNKIDEKIDKITKEELLPLIEKNIIDSLEKYLDCKSDHDFIDNKLVIVIKKKLTYEQNLGVKKYFQKEIKDYVRICYQWDFDDELSVNDVLKLLKEKINVEHEAESILINNYELLKLIIETVDVINNLLIRDVKCVKVHCDNYYIWITINLPYKHLSDDWKEVKNKIYSEIDYNRDIVLSFRELKDDEK